MSGDGRRRRHVSRTVVYSVATVAAVVLVWAIPGFVRFAPEAPSAFWAMSLAALIVDIPLFGLSGPEDLRIRSTLSVCFAFAIFVLYGAAPAIVVQAVAASVSMVGQRYRPRAGIHLIARLILAAAASELVLALTDGRPVTTPGGGLDVHDVLAFVQLAAVWCAVNYGLLAVARATVRERGLRQATAEVRYDLFSTAAAVLIVSPLLTMVTAPSVLILAFPLIVFNTLARAQMRQEDRLSREPESGLLNRQGFTGGMRAITDYDAIQDSGPQPFGIILVNVESVLNINRALGRDVYESVVSLASRRLVDVYGETRTGRLSGDGISILVPDLTAADALGQAEAAVSVLTPPIYLDDVPFALDPAAGVALSPLHGRELGTLLAKAELAVTEARRHGKRVMVYVPDAAEVTTRRMALLHDVGTALVDPDRRDELTVLYQPQVELTTGQLYGVEALLRWAHPVWGAIPTDELIESIEPSEVMHLLTTHVLETVAAQIRAWNHQDQPLRAAVNVSVQDLQDPGFVDQVGALVRRHGIPPEQLTIEITERMLVLDAPRVSRVCDELKRLGIGLSLDDFGTGYASMQQLRQLPLTEVKVDRSYVQGIVDNPADLAIVTSVSQLARALGVRIVAEGVEDQRTADALNMLAGMVGQGYHFAHPMSADELRNWVAQPSR
ncbi:MAG TPA: GGDEF domain-containing phosphodiesterase [Micromonosporaceae bacterium]